MEDLDVLGTEDAHLQVFEPVEAREIQRLVLLDIPVNVHSADNQYSLFVHHWDDFLRLLFFGLGRGIV